MRAGRLFVAVVLLCMSMICRAGKGGADVKIAYSADNGRYYATVSRRNESRKVGLGAEKDVLGLPRDASLYTEPYSEKAYGLLFAPIEPYLKPGDRIFFSPAGFMHFCNLGALKDSQGRYLFDKYRFFRTGNLANIHEDNGISADTYLLLFGGMDYDASPTDINADCWYCHTSDLQYLNTDVKFAGAGNIDLGETSEGTRAGISTLRRSRDEIKFIYRLQHLDILPRTGVSASEEQFRMSIRRTVDYMVHISTHSFNADIPIFPEDSPETMTAKQLAGSGLLFSGAARSLRGEGPFMAVSPQGKPLGAPLNDGLLNGAEIARLDMSHCSMAVLAACNTASGIVSQDGIVGLQTAFKMASVQTILMTLWSVNDTATSEFMMRFYTYLIAGKTKHEALDFARSDLMHSMDFSDPFYWAPFIMLD